MTSFSLQENGGKNASFCTKMHLHIIYAVVWHLSEGEVVDFIRSTSKSRPNNIRGGKMSVRPSIRPSVRPQKVSSISMKFGIQVEVDE